MPRVSGKRADDRRLVLALDDGVLIGPEGDEYVIRKGQRCYASRPAVQIAPHMFADANLDDEDLAAARRALLERAGVAV